MFRDIRVELDGTSRPVGQQHKDQVYEASPNDHYLPQLIVLGINKGYASHDAERGRIEDIRFQDIHVTAPGIPPSRLQGHDAEHLVQRVTIENLRINGQEVTDLASGGISANEFVRDVTVRSSRP